MHPFYLGKWYLNIFWMARPILVNKTVFQIVEVGLYQVKVDNT